MTEESAADWASRLKITNNEKSETNEQNTIQKLYTESPTLHDSRVATKVLLLEDQPFDTEEGDRLFSLEQREQELVHKRMAERSAKRKYTPFEDENEDGIPFSTNSTLTVTSFPIMREKVDKTVSRRNIRRRVAEFTDEPKPSVDITTTLPSTRQIETVSLDDDDLQRSLAKSRRKITTTLPLQLLYSQPLEDEEILKDDDTEQRGMVFTGATALASVIKAHKVGISEESLQNMNAGMVPFENTANHLKSAPAIVPDKEDATPLMPVFEKEPLVRRGVAATLQFLLQLGLRPQLASEKKPPLQRKPDVKRFTDIKIEHYDEHGNVITPKEAYKLLSHRFHGTIPSKGKKDKVLKRQAEQQRMDATALTDTPLGIMGALKERQRTTGTSHVVLAQGSHASNIISDAMAVDDVKPKLKVQSSNSRKQESKVPRIFGMK